MSVVSEEKPVEVVVDPTPDVRQTAITIPLTSSLILGDCVKVLAEMPPSSVDHILTDPPYAIDMRNLSQASTSLIDTSRVEETHDVEQNLQLLEAVIPLLYRVLDPHGYCIVFCDIMNWHRLYEWAIAAGFAVQRWPIVWCKTSQCKNQMAHVNFTKNIELIMVMRKQAATLPSPIQTCYYLAEREEGESNPFVKPQPLLRWLIECISVKGQLILDPFAGEGSTALAALATFRKYKAIEVDARHFNVMVEKMKNQWLTIFPNAQFV
jgi:DNA modification methylase